MTNTRNSSGKVSNRNGKRSTTWKKRNDSANVFGSMCNEQNFVSNSPSLEIIVEDGQTMQRPTVVSDKCYVYSPLPQYHYSNCYCRKSPIFPKYLKKLDDKINHKISNKMTRMLHRANKYNGYTYNDRYDTYYTDRCLRRNSGQFAQRFCSCDTCLYNEGLRETIAGQDGLDKSPITEQTKNLGLKHTPSREAYEVSKRSPSFVDEYKKALDKFSKTVENAIGKEGGKSRPTTPKKSTKVPPSTSNFGNDPSKYPSRTPSPTVPKTKQTCVKPNSPNQNFPKTNLNNRKFSADQPNQRSGSPKRTSSSPRPRINFAKRSPPSSPRSQKTNRGTSTNKPSLEKLQEIAKVNLIETSAETESDLKKLSTFRKENYFDCHRSGKTNSRSPSPSPASSPSPVEDGHQCTFEFEVNDRLITEPVKPNVFGTCSCSTCDKPLNDKFPVTRNKRLSKQVVPNRKSWLETNDKSFLLTKMYEENALYKDKKVEIRIPLHLKDDMGVMEKCKVHLKCPVPTDSFALKHQKGVIKACKKY